MSSCNKLSSYQDKHYTIKHHDMIHRTEMFYISSYKIQKNHIIIIRDRNNKIIAILESIYTEDQYQITYKSLTSYLSEKHSCVAILISKKEPRKVIESEEDLEQILELWDMPFNHNNKLVGGSIYYELPSRY